MVDVENVSRDLPAAQDESPSKKAKTAAGGVDAADADAQPSSTKGKFKIVGRVVMAMKRFQGEGHLHQPGRAATPTAVLTRVPPAFLLPAASLNPTYSYGKRSSDGGGVVEQVSSSWGRGTQLATVAGVQLHGVASNPSLSRFACVPLPLLP
jgi:hypothetical protein